MSCPRSSKSRRGFIGDRSGATAIEFALIAPLLIYMILSIIELGVLGLFSSGLDVAVSNTSRMIRTGQTDAPTTAGAFRDAICNQMGGPIADCRTRLFISVNRYAKFGDATAFNAAAPDGSFNKGGPGDIIVVKADYHWPLMSPFLIQAYQHTGPFEVVIGSRLAFKNEPFG